jgi:hypothetical protein
MTDIATDLKERFWSSELWYREKWEMYGVNPDGKSIPDVWTDEEMQAIESPEDAARLRRCNPAVVDQSDRRTSCGQSGKIRRDMVRGVQLVGFGFFSTSATEFVETLN